MYFTEAQRRIVTLLNCVPPYASHEAHGAASIASAAASRSLASVAAMAAPPRVNETLPAGELSCTSMAEMASPENPCGGCPLHRRGSRVPRLGRPWVCAAAADVYERRSTEC